MSIAEDRMHAAAAAAVDVLRDPNSTQRQRAKVADALARTAAIAAIFHTPRRNP